MNKKNNLQYAAKKANKGSKIPTSATQIKMLVEDHDNENPVFSFKHVCNNHCLLSSWQSREVNQLIQRLKLVEQLPWKEIKTHPGINYKPIDNYVFRLPPTVPRESVIHEFKVDERKRLLGYRDGRVFCFIWFDRNHETIPMDKSRAKR